jgi:hypothetical protein
MAVRYRSNDMPVNISESIKCLTLWRYMSLEKLLDILRTGTLHFSPLKSFRDSYEGTVPIAWQGAVSDLSQLPDLVGDSSKSSGWHPISIVPGDGVFLTDQKIHEVYVSCWHANPGESAAMWSLYAQDGGVAIKTTTEYFSDALRDCQVEVELAAVQYLEFVPGLMSGNPWAVKRPSFEHENEVRAAVREPDGNGEGLSIAVDVKTLIEEILVSPDSPKWIECVVRDVVAKYGLSKPVRQSSLYTRQPVRRS